MVNLSIFCDDVLSNKSTKDQPANRSYGRPGGVLARLGASSARFGDVMARLGTSWAHLGRVLGASWACLGGVVARLGGVLLKRLWLQFGASEAPKTMENVDYCETRKAKTLENAERNAPRTRQMRATGTSKNSKRLWLQFGASEVRFARRFSIVDT